MTTRGDDDTIASTDPRALTETVAQSRVDLGSAQTLGSEGAGLAAIAAPLPVVPVENYVRIDEYARGGLGRIIRAKDAYTGRYVAIKEMLADNADVAARFVREAMVTANLQHPAIVPVYEVGKWPDGKPFYAMKLVHGRALSDVIASTKDLDGRLALISHVAAVADALAYAHGEHVIHRDLKPHNVLCGDFGETVVIDWGLARKLDDVDESSLPPVPSTIAAPGETHVGAVMGTPSYMPPEQARGERADQQSDVYAIGAILYHLLAGRPPHVASDLVTLLDRVKNATPDKLPPEVPPDLVAIVERAIARERSTRYPSAAELASELRRFMTGQLVLAHNYTRGQRLARFVSRNRTAIAVGGAALAVVAIVGTIAIRNVVVARREATASRDDATASRDEARQRLVTSYVDRAGVELVSGQPARSLAYTIAAAQVSGLTPQTRLMASHALDQLPAVRWFADPSLVYAQFVPGSHELIIAKDDIVRWDPETEQVRWRIPYSRGGDLRVIDRDTLAFSRKGAIVLVTAAGGLPVGEIQGSANADYSGVMGADANSRWLAAPTRDRIDLFDVPARVFVASIPFSQAVGAPMISPDGELVLVTDVATKMSVLDRTGKVVVSLDASAGSIAYAGDELVYSPMPKDNGIARLVVGDWMGKARLDLSIGNSPIHAVAVDPVAKRVVVGTDDGLVQVRSLVGGEVLWQASLGEQAEGVSFDGNVVHVVGTSLGLVGFDVTSGVEVERASIPGSRLVSSDDHTRVAMLSYGREFAVWAPGRGQVAPIAPTSAKVVDLAFASDNSMISGGEDGDLYEVRADRSTRKLGTGAPINTLARLDDGTLITASRDGTIVVRDRDGHEQHRFAGGSIAIASPDQRLIATAPPTADGIVAIWDPATGTRVRELGVIGSLVRTIRWTNDSRRIAAMTMLGDVTVYDLDGNVVRRIPKPRLLSANVAFSSDGKWLARSGGPADTLFALDGGRDRKLLDMPTGAVLHVAFSSDDKSLLAAGTGFISTWDVATGAPKLRIATNSWTMSAAFFDNDRYIVGTGTDRRVHMWNAETGAELLALTLPAPPRKIVVEKSGSRIAVLTMRGAIVWTVPTFTGTLDELRERARCRLDVEVVDAHLRARPIDTAACNRAAR